MIFSPIIRHISARKALSDVFYLCVCVCVNVFLDVHELLCLDFLSGVFFRAKIVNEVIETGSKSFVLL